MTRLALAALFLVLATPTTAMADFATGWAAYNRGDYSTALREWRPLAEQGNAVAQYNLGNMYDNGEGVAEDDAEAVKWFRRAAEQGYADAQYNLGVMYAKGEGMAENDAEAVKWFRRAAEQGYADAQYNLGNMYNRGEGVAENDAEAVKWFRRAAEQGYAKAQLNLGVMYAKGEGVAENYVQAYRWTSLAAASGNQDARHNLKILRGQMTPNQIAEAQRLAAGGKVDQQATGWSSVGKSDIKRIQQALNDLGFDVGPADGVAGRRTKSALQTFQRVKGLSVGNPDSATLQALGIR